MSLKQNYFHASASTGITLISEFANTSIQNILLLNEMKTWGTFAMMPKLVTSVWAWYDLAPGQQISEETSRRWRAVGGAASNLTVAGIEVLTSHTDSDVFNTILRLSVLYCSKSDSNYIFSKHIASHSQNFDILLEFNWLNRIKVVQSI